jgi:rfaE bifunctional protein kinase chain/domain
MDAFLSLDRLHEILNRIRGLRVGIVGDLTLDGYWFADMTRSQLSREAPLFPRPVTREQYSCGGAANAAWNAAALRPAQASAFTVFGRDWRAGLLLDALQQAGVDTQPVMIDPNWTTPFFGKVMLQSGKIQQEDARLDFINTNPLSPETEEELLSRLEAALPELDALIIADYQEIGVITPRLIDGLNELAAAFPNTTFTVDSRERISRFKNMVRKPNDLEAARWLFPGRAPSLVGLDELAETGLHPQIACACPLFITLGEKGCLVLDGGESHLVPAVSVALPIDTVGAGDTFLAALTLALAGGASAVEAARMGHIAASVTIRKLGITGAASPEEMIESYSLPTNSPGSS